MSPGNANAARREGDKTLSIVAYTRCTRAYLSRYESSALGTVVGMSNTALRAGELRKLVLAEGSDSKDEDASCVLPKAALDAAVKQTKPPAPQLPQRKLHSRWTDSKKLRGVSLAAHHRKREAVHRTNVFA